MENKKTHWRNLTNEKYLGHWDLEINGQYFPVNVTIERIYKDEFVGEMGKEQKVFAKFKEFNKSMLLNKTNLRAMELGFKSFNPDHFIGGVITLKVEKTKMKGALVDALRISPNLPIISNPVLSPEHEKWGAACEALKKGNTTIENILYSYDLSPADQETLKSITPQND